MPTRKSPRKGSLQFWPRKRATKFLPRVNWDAISTSKNLKGFICYKAGMTSVIAKDNTPDSLTKGKRIAIPVTILECPKMKIFSVRFYKDKKVAKDILASGLDKELKKRVKLPKKKETKIKEILEKEKEFDDVTMIVYSVVKKTNIKKRPDLIEVGLAGSNDEKINFIKENLGKEISVTDVYEKGGLVDVRGLTKGQGFSGPVKRFGIKLKFHKSEKGRRRPGNIGPWNPSRVTFRVPMAGQLGMFSRVVYNNKILEIGKNEDRELKSIKNFGDVKTDYVIVKGSVQGPAKRQLLITSPLRETKKTKKQDYEVLEVVK
ncbi:MAG: 50S ribosomal protein L3 [Candidatus Pacearchaeota archaeon]|jgi:large subunit ribosomal protein L3